MKLNVDTKVEKNMSNCKMQKKQNLVIHLPFSDG